MLRLDEIKIYNDLNEEEVIQTALKKKRIDPNDVLSVQIVKKSVDARDKHNVHYSYSLDLTVKNEKKYPKVKKIVYKKDEFVINRTSNLRPVIIGSGPAGLFCALELIENGFQPIIIEQGNKVEDRIRDVENYRKEGKLNPLSNVQFGEGGAGTFSDGKLTTNVNSPLIRKVLNTFYQFGADREITYLSKPHIGTDKLVTIIANIRHYIEEKGGTYYFNTRFTSYFKENGRLRVICEDKEFLTDALVLACGHSAFETFQMLQKNKVNLQRKVFAVGLRIEHKQKTINTSQYGEFTKLKLPPAEYKLAYHNEKRSCYSFCMCPGGEVISSSSDPESIVTNGMSTFARDKENANAALLVNVTPNDFAGDDPLAGLYFQKKLEHDAFVLAGSNYNAPVQRVEDFENNVKSDHIGEIVPSYQPGYTLSNLNEILPDYISSTIKEALPYFETKIEGFNHPDAILTGVETRSSSPVTIVRDETYQSSEALIYPCGEGAGYAGGITTAAIDGIKVARAIMAKK